MNNVSKLLNWNINKRKINHYYNENIESKWTPIEPITKDIKVGKTYSFVITRIQFLVELATWRIIHHPQGLSLDELVLIL